MAASGPYAGLILCSNQRWMERLWGTTGQRPRLHLPIFPFAEERVLMALNLEVNWVCYKPKSSRLNKHMRYGSHLKIMLEMTSGPPIRLRQPLFRWLVFPLYLHPASSLGCLCSCIINLFIFHKRKWVVCDPNFIYFHSQDAFSL